MKYFITIIFIALLFTSCKTQSPSMDEIAESYVRLSLEIGLYDSDFIDAYYGPEEWKPKVEKSDSLPSDKFINQANALLKQCENVDQTNYKEIDKARLSLMKKQLIAVKTKVEMMAGKVYSFDEEARLLYDTDPPHFTEDYFDNVLAELEKTVPGKGDLSTRYNEYASQFIIKKDKLDIVFKKAIDEGRKRTMKYVDLPENENFVLEFVSNKSWGGYNYYQGNSQSLIQINTDSPSFIQRAIDTGCHEGYPGHHFLNARLEQNLVNKMGWKEFSVYPLFTPMSLIAEGTANYGIEVAFPGEEKITFETEVLYPLAGLDPAKAVQYSKISELRSKLGYAGNEAARKYLNGEISREDAAKWNEKYLLMTPKRALQRISFVDQYRSYVINYNWGKDLVKKFIESNGGTADNPEKRWELFIDLVSNPHSASDLK
ncbi:MAG: hypothetical protein D8M58_12500 [Calditrichaeota bacterium]|nr:MAG: hypothetical protein DWQ03_13285 [Calditrichota bacterium]MBL1206217.1 hypothetical protein [Calditrichota bacterium]NOG46043.1 hypothetical protein [Calditrichota bacterium]